MNEDSQSQAPDRSHARRQKSRLEPSHANETEKPRQAPVPLWLTREQACERLGCSTRSLSRLVNKGRVESTRVGQKRRYRILENGATPEIEATPPEPKAPGEEIGAKSHARRQKVDGVASIGSTEAYQQLTELLNQALEHLAQSQQQALTLSEELGQTRAQLKELEGERNAGLAIISDMTGELLESERRLVVVEKGWMARCSHLETSLRDKTRQLRVTEYHRKQLQKALDNLRSGIGELASSAMAWPVRKRLRAFMKGLPEP